MKRLHVHISVPNLDQAIRYYSLMFGSEPDKHKDDYARWLLDDPQINFAISTRSEKIGLDHLGIQVGNEAELELLHTGIQQADKDAGTLDKTTCCYAESIKAWSFDPAGIPWESFVTMKDAEIYGVDTITESKSNSACCAGAAPTSSNSCCG